MPKDVFDLKKLGRLELERLNTATKYGSIETYHPLSSRGIPEGEPRYVFGTGEEGTEQRLFTEKIDGTNFRVVALPDGSVVIGNRNGLLTAIGDVIHNPAERIVDTVREWATTLPTPTDGSARVYFGEVYGGTVGQNAKQYTTAKTMTGFKIFDIADVKWIWHVTHNWELGDISEARDGGSLQNFLTEAQFKFALHDAGLNELDDVPRRLMVTDTLPTDPEYVYEWLEKVLPTSYAVLDPSGEGKAEGVVVRTLDRSQILKVRFEDYAKLMKKLYPASKG